MEVLGGGFQLKWKARYLFSRIYDLIFERGGALIFSMGNAPSRPTPTIAPLAPTQTYLWRAPANEATRH